MSDAAHPLVLAVARALADGQRVLLAGDSFEALQVLAAADVRELVVVSPRAEATETAGETAGGAPLKVRPDWRERPSSKDLVVDPDGVAAPDDVARVLKKRGVYVTGRPGPALEALGHRTAVTARRLGALVVGDAPGTTIAVATDGEEGPTVYLAGKSEAPAVPALVCTVPPPPAAEPGDGERVALLEGRVAELEAALADARADAARLGEVERERDEARRALVDTEAELEAAQAELAERRVQDKRADLVRRRFEEAQQAMNAELESLRAQLRELAEPAADLEALRGQRDALRDTARRVATALAQAVADLADPDEARPEIGLPPPGTLEDASLVDAWLEQIRSRVSRLREARRAADAALADTQARLRAAERRARELGEALAALEARAAEPPPAPAVVEAAEATELRARVEQLEAALEAERSLRRSEREERDRIRRAADAAIAEATTHRERIRALSEEAARARLARAALDDEVARLRAERSLRAARVADLEAMLAEHARMAGLLSASLDEAVRAREMADGERRLADESLRLLRAEFERRVGHPPPATAAPSRASS